MNSIAKEISNITTMDDDNDRHNRKLLVIRGEIKIESFVERPIHCGYLLLFCGSQFCSENLHFAMEVDRFRDIFSFDPTGFFSLFFYFPFDFLLFIFN